MTDIQLRSDIKVEAIQWMGNDEIIAKAARVSTGKDQEDNDKITGLINYLARERHTSPFEHTALTVRIEAPIIEEHWPIAASAWKEKEKDAKI